MSSKICGNKIKLKRILSPDIPAALHSSDDVTHSCLHTTHAFFRYTCWRRSKDRWKCPYKNEWKNSSQTAAIFEKTVMVIDQYVWVRGETWLNALMLFLFLSSEKWGQKSERHIRYRLLSRFSLKINIAAYGAAAGLLLALRLLKLF